MNILIVNPNIWMGGTQIIVVNLARQLERSGHNVYVLTTDIDFDCMPAYARSLKYLRHPVGLLERTNGLYRPPANRATLLAAMLRLRRAIKRAISEHQIHVLNPHLPPCHWLCAFLSVPVVWSCNEPVSPWQSRLPYFPLQEGRPSPPQRAMERIFEAVDRGLVRCGVSRIVVLSDKTRRDVRAIYGMDAVVCHPGVGDEFFSCTDGSRAIARYGLAGRFVIMQAAHLKPEKNQLLSIQLIDRLKSDVPSVKLVLVGEGGQRATLSAEIAKRNLQEHVVFTGRAGASRLTEIYAASHVVVVPARNQSWGLTAFEGLAAGVIPVVAEDCGGADLIRQERIGYVAEPTVEGFAREITDIYRHFDRARQAVEKGREFIRAHLTYEAHARGVETILLDASKGS